MTSMGSNTIKMKVLTRIRQRERDDGSAYFIFDGITSESVIAHATIGNERHFEKLSIGSFIMLTKFRINNTRPSGIFVNIDDAMVSIEQ